MTNEQQDPKAQAQQILNDMIDTNKRLIEGVDKYNQTVADNEADKDQQR